MNQQAATAPSAPAGHIDLHPMVYATTAKLYRRHTAVFETHVALVRVGSGKRPGYLTIHRTMLMINAPTTLLGACTSLTVEVYWPDSGPQANEPLLPTRATTLLLRELLAEPGRTEFLLSWDGHGSLHTTWHEPGGDDTVLSVFDFIDRLDAEERAVKTVPLASSKDGGK